MTVGGAFVYVWKPLKEIPLKIFNNCRVYITRSVITRFFSWTPDDCVIMASQCIIILVKMILFIASTPKLLTIKQALVTEWPRLHTQLSMLSHFQVITSNSGICS